MSLVSHRTLRAVRLPRGLIVLSLVTLFLLCCGWAMEHGRARTRPPAERAGAVALSGPGGVCPFLVEDGEPCAETLPTRACVERHQPCAEPSLGSLDVAALPLDLAQQPTRPFHLAAFLILLHLDPAAE
jgi:hypothetical protein